MINRNIIRDQFVIRNIQRGDRSDYDRERFCELIDKWKSYVHNEMGIVKGNIACLGLMNCGVKTHALVFALAELGIQIVPAVLSFNKDIITDSPITVLKPEAGFWDNIAIKMCDGIAKEVVPKEFELVGNTGVLVNVDDVDLDSYEMKDFPKEFAGPNDPLYITWDDGLEDDMFKLNYYTHKDVAAYSARNGSIFNLKDTLAVHTFNLSHSESLMTYMIPAYLYCVDHVTINFWDRLAMWNPALTTLMCNLVNTPKEKKIMIKNEETLENLVVRMTKEGKKSTFFIYPYGEFTENLLRIVRKYNIRVCILTGEQRAKCFTLFTKVIDKDTVFEEGNVGVVLDKFFNLVYNSKEKVVLVRSNVGREYVQLSNFYTKKDNGEYIKGERIFKSVYSIKVKEILGHDNFDILSKYGRHYLVVYEDFDDKEFQQLEDMNYFKDIVQQSKKAYCIENGRCRYWFNLKNQLEYGFDNYETERLRYQDE